MISHHVITTSLAGERSGPCNRREPPLHRIRSWLVQPQVRLRTSPLTSAHSRCRMSHACSVAALGADSRRSVELAARRVMWSWRLGWLPAPIASRSCISALAARMPPCGACLSSEIPRTISVRPDVYTVCHGSTALAAYRRVNVCIVSGLRWSAGRPPRSPRARNPHQHAA